MGFPCPTRHRPTGPADSPGRDGGRDVALRRARGAPQRPYSGSLGFPRARGPDRVRTQVRWVLLVVGFPVSRDKISPGRDAAASTWTLAHWVCQIGQQQTSLNTSKHNTSKLVLRFSISGSPFRGVQPRVSCICPCQQVLFEVLLR